MKYLRATMDAYDYFNKYAVIEGELLTETERDRKARYIADHVFEEVEIPRTKTYKIYDGSRFEIKER